MQLFMQNLAKSDKAHYDQLVELMRLYKLVDVDLRLVSQLKASFISKDSGTLAQIPLSSLQESMRTIFKHFRQVDDIVEMTGQCISVEVTKDGAKEQMADASRLATLVEFMKCYPVLVKRDKNTSQGINYVLRADQPSMVSLLYSPLRILRSLMELLERARISECLGTA